MLKIAGFKARDCPAFCCRAHVGHSFYGACFKEKKREYRGKKAEGLEDVMISLQRTA
jgi:hypothetical protein